MSFSEIASRGIQHIYAIDHEVQEHYIRITCEQVRHMKPDIVYEMEGFFVPNNDYMKHMFGEAILDPAYDCYDTFGNCKWDNLLVIPIFGVFGDIVGFVGFDPFNKLRTQDPQYWSLRVYKNSSKILLDKEVHLFGKKGLYRRAFEEGYIILTDGVFDTVHASAYGLNAGALLGSSVSPQLIAILTLVDKVYLAMDNDEAGLRLYQDLKKHLKNLRCIRNRNGKDLDDLLHTNKVDKFLKLFNENLQSDITLDIYI